MCFTHDVVRQHSYQADTRKMACSNTTVPGFAPSLSCTACLCRDQHEQATVELRQQLTAAEEAQSQQKRQIVELKQQLAAARGWEDQHAAEMAALATQLAVAAHDLDVARGGGELLQQRVQVGTASHMASWGQSETQHHKIVVPCLPAWHHAVPDKTSAHMRYLFFPRAQELEAQCAASSQACAAASTGTEELHKQLAVAQAAATQAGREHRAALDALQVALPTSCLIS